MKKILLVHFVLVALTVQAQQNTFERVVYDAASQTPVEAHAVTPAQGGGYVVVGMQNYTNGYLLRTDSAGTPVWSRYCSGGTTMQFNAITPSIDSGYVVAGSMVDPTLPQATIIVQKIDNNGDTLWHNTLSFPGYSLTAWSIIQTFDSSYVLAGTASNLNLPYSQIVVAKLSPVGNLLWLKLFSSGNWENTGSTIKQLPDSSFLVGASMEDGPNPFVFRSSLFKISPSGSVIWAKSFPLSGNGFSQFCDLEILSDGVMLFLNTNNYSSLVKTDFNGSVIWQKTYSMPMDGVGNQNPPHLHQTSDKGYIFMSGNVFLGGSYLVKTDSSGNDPWGSNFILGIKDVHELSTKELFATGNGPLYGLRGPNVFYPQIGFDQVDSLANPGNCNYDFPVSIFPLALTDSSIILTEITGGAVVPISLIWNPLPVANLIGCVDITGSLAKIDENNSITIQPNPSHGIVTIVKNTNEIISVCFADMYGKEIYRKTLNSSVTTVDLGFVTNGIYCYSAYTANKMMSMGKISIFR